MADGDNNTPNQVVPTDENGTTTDNRPKFVTNILYEDSGSVYGMEILLYNREDKSIEKILVVDETEFDAWADLIDNLNNAYTHYTDNDLQLLQELKTAKENYNNNRITKEQYEEQVDAINESWSELQQMGSLETILKNKIVNGVFPVEINATKFDGLDSNSFSKEGHGHAYAPMNHSSRDNEYGIGSESEYGHVKIINNLNATEYVSGQVLSAYQGTVLKKDIATVDGKYSWDNFKTLDTDGYMRLKVNEDLHLVVFEYRRESYTGLAKKTGLTELHNSSKGIPEPYRPTGRVLTPLYRGDVVLYVRTDGSVNLYNLTTHKSINIYAQLMWYYD